MRRMLNSCMTREKAAIGRGNTGAGSSSRRTGKPAPPQKEKGRPGTAVHRCAGHLRPGVPGGCRAGGHRRRELSHHRLYRRRYKLAQQAGHTLIEPVPSLVSLVSHDADCKKMMGLALKNVTLTLFEDSKAIFDEQAKCCSLILASAAR